MIRERERERERERGERETFMYWNTLIFLAEYLLKSCSDLLGKPTGVFTGEQSNNASILTARLYIELATINITLLIAHGPVYYIYINRTAVL